MMEAKGQQGAPAGQTYGEGVGERMARPRWQLVGLMSVRVWADLIYDDSGHGQLVLRVIERRMRCPKNQSGDNICEGGESRYLDGGVDICRQVCGP